jgi:ubiquinone biosynthesis protein
VQGRIKIEDESLERGLQPFLSGFATPLEKLEAIQNALGGDAGKFWRAELGKWTVRMVPVELLVPEVHRQWRPLVHEAMLFVVSKLSASRLAPKILEQVAMAADTPPAVRLLRFIAKVPGLQKIGQVLARNRNLDPRLRRALIQLENGISDVTIEEISAIIHGQLQSRIESCAIKLKPAILSEASVSAVVAFTWRNPASGRRERGVFKVLKPHIPGCYAEDMKIIEQLAQHLARKHRAEGTRVGGLAETLTEIRLLLEREVDFPREQATLAGALREYRSIRGIRVPHLIPALSTSTITALTYESGKKATEVRIGSAKDRVKVASKLAQAMLAVPAFSREKDSIFHADPHAGNLLYDKRHDELVILDWALTGQLARRQRKNVALLILMMILRDADAMVKAIKDLCQLSTSGKREPEQIIRRHVERVLDELPLTKLPGPMDAMRLLDDIALDGVRFPAALLMFRKASFTLEGVVEDITGSRVRLDSLVAGYVMAHWKESVAGLLSLFSPGDWLALDWSALTFTSRVCARALLRPWYWLPRLLPKTDAA